MVTKRLRTRFGPRGVLSCLLGVLLASGLAWAEDEPKLAGVEVPAPKRTRFVAPEYPAEAKAQGQRGIVILSLVIGVNGRVTAAEVVKSVPVFDEAALAAAHLWEYEITKVDGKAVPVRLSVPIAFALRLPDVTRESGVRELREGLAPNRPAGVSDKAEATVVTALTVQPSGEVVTIEVEKGAWPWFESTAAALRTWAFVADGAEAVVTYEVETRFRPVRKGQARVDLRIARRATSAVVTEPAAEPLPTPEPSALAELPPPELVPATPGPPTTPPVEPTPATEPVPPPASPQAPDHSPKESGAPRPPASLPPATAMPSSTPTVMPGATVPGSSGVSAVRDVNLGPGVPDLASGRRPVVPPLARMGDVSGTVEVRFTVDAGGVTSGVEVSGPEPLREAARQAVVSWSFRRTSAERLFLIAHFEYRGWQASATVERAAP